MANTLDVNKLNAALSRILTAKHGYKVSINIKKGGSIDGRATEGKPKRFAGTDHPAQYLG